MNQINDEFYELLSGQSDALKEPEAHPYDVDWSKYDQLQTAPQIEGEGPVTIDLKDNVQSFTLSSCQ